jgi:hypothetical protein
VTTCPGGVSIGALCLRTCAASFDTRTRLAHRRNPLPANKSALASKKMPRTHSIEMDDWRQVSTNNSRHAQIHSGSTVPAGMQSEFTRVRSLARCKMNKIPSSNFVRIAEGTQKRRPNWEKWIVNSEAARTVRLLTSKLFCLGRERTRILSPRITAACFRNW